MRVDRLRRAFAMDVVYRHFPLHPATPPGGLSLEELFAGRNIDIPAAHAKMSRLMAEEGLPYGPRTATYNSRLAQELAAWAQSLDGDTPIHDALFRAYFVDNKNLAMVENLVTIAVGVGLPEMQARHVLEQRTFREAVDADWRRSRELGITGVPTFVMDHRGLVGAQPYEQLEALALSVGAARRE